MILAAVQAGSSFNVVELACETVLALGGLGALAWQIKRARRQPPAGVAAWRATLLDFGIWVWIVFFAIYLGVNVLRVLHPSVVSQPAKSMHVLLLASAAQAAALAAQLALIWSKRPFSPAPVNQAKLSAGRVLVEAALAWLAAYPLVAIASISWQWLLQLAQKIWVNLQTPPQETVKMLAHSTSFRENALMIFFAVLVAPVAEELFFRAGLYRFLKSRLPANLALAATSFLFALSHFNLETFLPLLVLGWLLARLYERTGNIAPSILFHALFNLAMILLILLFPSSSLSLQPAP